MSAAVRTTCPYCGVGCGVLASAGDDDTASVRGDPHSLEWDNQPRPFKVYTDLDAIPLPRDFTTSTRPALTTIADPGNEAGDGPPLGGNREGLGDRVLGEIDVAEDADHRGGAATGFSPEHGIEVVTHPGTGEPRPDPRRRRRPCGPSRGRRRDPAPR